jgi:hypothetical protein
MQHNGEISNEKEQNKFFQSPAYDILFSLLLFGFGFFQKVSQTGLELRSSCLLLTMVGLQKCELMLATQLWMLSGK